MRLASLALFGLVLGTGCLPRSMMRHQSEDPSIRKRGLYDDHFSGFIDLGGRFFQSNAMSPVENQLVLGVDGAWVPGRSPVGLELGGSWSFAPRIDPVDRFRAEIQGESGELYLGARIEIPLGRTIPFTIIGGIGPSWIRTKLEIEQFGSNLRETEYSWGLYLHGGVTYSLGDAYLGLDLRGLTRTEAELFGTPGSADYIQLALLIGVRF